MSGLILRAAYDAAQVRWACGGGFGCRSGPRLLAIAMACEGRSRAEAAWLAGMDRYTLRDWVVRFDAIGPEGLIDRSPPGAARRLTAEQEAEFAQLVEEGPAAAGLTHPAARRSRSATACLATSHTGPSPKPEPATPRQHCHDAGEIAPQARPHGHPAAGPGRVACKQSSLALVHSAAPCGGYIQPPPLSVDSPIQDRATAASQTPRRASSADPSAGQCPAKNHQSSQPSQLSRSARVAWFHRRLRPTSPCRLTEWWQSSATTSVVRCQRP